MAAFFTSLNPCSGGPSVSRRCIERRCVGESHVLILVLVVLRYRAFFQKAEIVSAPGLNPCSGGPSVSRRTSKSGLLDFINTVLILVLVVLRYRGGNSCAEGCPSPEVLILVLVVLRYRDFINSSRPLVVRLVLILVLVVLRYRGGMASFFNKAEVS